MFSFRYSGNILRIGHVTGVCTDIGVHIGRYVMGAKDNIWRIQILISLLLSFFFGGFVARKLHPVLGKYQLLLSAGISFLIGFIYIIYLHTSQYHLSYFQSIFGFSVPEPMDSERISVESNYFTEVKTIYSSEFFERDHDYDLTQEEAGRLHCTMDGELLDENNGEGLIEPLLRVTDQIDDSMDPNFLENRARYVFILKP